MSLDIDLIKIQPVSVFNYNITHNLTKMANKAGLYQYLWRPEELNIFLANDLISPLTRGLKKLQENPDYFKKYNPENGWGDYDCLVNFVEKYLEACKDNPEAKIEVCR